jgi:hypothetical protein
MAPQRTSAALRLRGRHSLGGRSQISTQEASRCEAASVVVLSARANGGQKPMAQTIEIGTLLVKSGTLLPESVQLESDPYLKGWKLVKNLSSSGMDRKLCEVGWTFFYMAGEVNAIAFGSDSEETTRRAVKKVIANMKSDRYNCLEISRVAAKSFMELPYVTVAAHPRHVQESIYLFHAKHIPEWDQARLAAI